MDRDHLSRFGRAERSLAGLSVGDAFGEQHFGLPTTIVPRIEARQLPEGPWRWTDDTAMALSIRDVLREHGAIDQDALAAGFARRFREDRMRGYGAKAQDILEAIYSGTPWKIAARLPYRDGSKGNGGAMRAAPVGAYFAGDLKQVAEQARRSAEITHAHPEGIAGAIAVALAAAWACTGEVNMFDVVLSALPDSETRRRCESIADFHGAVWQAATRVGAGENVLAEDTVPFSLWCAARHIDSYEDALWATVSALGDRDTTCAIVGGIVALRSPPPDSWVRRREPLR
ncbi:MAG: ADP-ribosylglycohydrolase family protein [Myxococcaceae bacterium]|nr:ADP-ribosylglycohydrolase family protein [Myxococcaceae bacterium]